MEIRRVLRGENARPAAARPVQGGEKDKTAARPSADRLELSCQWAESMEQQRFQAQTALLSGAKEKKQSNTILDMLDGPDSEELKAETDQLKVRRRCMEIARRIMAGKKVPPRDLQYLMEHDPEGYKMAIALRKPPKKNEKECESVLKDEEEGSGETGETGETGESAPVEGGGAPSGGGESASSGGEE